MRALLNKPLTEILQTRVYISRSLRVFNLGQIAKEWEMARITIFRYNSPEYREYSRTIAKKQNLNKTTIKGQCQICPLPLKGHERCRSCTILIHGEKKCSCIYEFDKELGLL